MVSAKAACAPQAGAQSSEPSSTDPLLVASSKGDNSRSNHAHFPVRTPQSQMASAPAESPKEANGVVAGEQQTQVYFPIILVKI